MKYKVGDEVLVKVRIHHIVNHETDLPYEVKEINNGKIGPRTIWIGEEDVQPYPQMTAEEAWEIAKKILLYPAHGGFNATELEEIFGRSEHLWELTPQQAKAKIEAWESEKEIKVGDEVAHKKFPHDDSYKFFATEIDNECRRIGGFSGFSGEVFSGRDIDMYQKTGRHIDIEGMLNQIGDDER